MKPGIKLGRNMNIYTKSYINSHPNQSHNTRAIAWQKLFEFKLDYLNISAILEIQTAISQLFFPSLPLRFFMKSIINPKTLNWSFLYYYFLFFHFYNNFYPFKLFKKLSENELHFDVEELNMSTTGNFNINFI